ncbi:MAG: hypothetical protein IT385_15445 [Deltaproteobacteria bacterium]|nr:hypothetical protein [Deltaproteobacteria bacterium]
MISQAVVWPWLVFGGTGCADGASVASGADADVGRAEGASLCDEYGGPGVVSTVVQDLVIPEIAADCRVNQYFLALPPEALGHLAECLTIQVQELFGCEGVVYAGATDARGRACRSMAEAHAGLQLSKGDFDALIDDVVVAMTKAGIAEEHIAAAAPALLGMEGDIVAQPTIEAPTYPLGEACE